MKGFHPFLVQGGFSISAKKGEENHDKKKRSNGNPLQPEVDRSRRGIG
jgi:hypothetical protein